MSTAETPPDMTFPDIDTAESALDWIGIDFVEGEGEGDTGGWFTGELDADAVELIDAALADTETPLTVRALAQLLRQRWNDEAAPRAWRVTFPA
jgi:hypothetical protein